jgi:hypothetical protein
MRAGANKMGTTWTFRVECVAAKADARGGDRTRMGSYPKGFQVPRVFGWVRESTGRPARLSGVRAERTRENPTCLRWCLAQRLIQLRVIEQDVFKSLTHCFGLQGLRAHGRMRI